MATEANKTILYVEDNEHNRRIVRKILEKRGFTIIEADDGIRGLNTIRKERPPLVLLDISLPGMDGIEIARRVKADDELKHIFLIALTASAMRGDRERFLEAGCDDYMSKPFKALELIDMVEFNYKMVTSGGMGSGSRLQQQDSKSGTGGPPTLSAEKLKKLQEAKKDQAGNDNKELERKTQLRAIRGTLSLPSLPKERLEKIKEIKKETGQLDPPPVRMYVEEKESELPIHETKIVPRLDSGDLVLPEDKAEELEEHKRKTGILPPLEEIQKPDEENKPEIILRNTDTDSLAIPEDKTQQLEKIKKETGALDDGEDSNQPDTVRVSSPDSLAMPEEKLKKLEAAKKQAEAKKAKMPADDEIITSVSDIRIKASITTAMLPDLEEVEKAYEKAGEDPSMVPDLSRHETTTSMLPNLEEVGKTEEKTEEKPKAIIDSIHYDKTATLPDLESAAELKDEEKSVSKKIFESAQEANKDTDAPDLITDSIHYEKTAALPDLKSVMPAIETDEVKKDKKKKKTPKASTKPAKKVKSSKIDKIYDAILDQPTTKPSKTKKKTKEKNNKALKVGSVETLPEEKTTKKEKDKTKDNGAKAKKPPTKASAAKAEAAKPKKSKKSGAFLKMSKGIEEQINATILDTINPDHIDPADPNIDKPNKS